MFKKFRTFCGAEPRYVNVLRDSERFAEPEGAGREPELGPGENPRSLLGFRSGTEGEARSGAEESEQAEYLEGFRTERNGRYTPQRRQQRSESGNNVAASRRSRAKRSEFRVIRFFERFPIGLPDRFGMVCMRTFFFSLSNL